MDVSVAGPLATSPSAGPDAAVPGVPSGPGWIVLRDCPLGGDGPLVGLALLHPKIGVALVDFAPTPADAADRLRRALDARRFPAIFGGYPPIVRVVLPADRLPELGQVLSARFKAEPQFALGGEDAWLPTVRSALEEEPAATPTTTATAAVPAPRRGASRQDVSPWRAVVFVLGAAASGAAAAAIAVAPPWRGSGGAPAPAVAVAALQPTDPPPFRSVPDHARAPIQDRIAVPEVEVDRPGPEADARVIAARPPAMKAAVPGAPSPETAAPRPAPESPAPESAAQFPSRLKADTGAGSEAALAPVPQEAGGEPLPPSPALSKFREDWPGPPQATADAAHERPGPIPPAEAVPDPTSAVEESPAPTAPVRSAGFTNAPPPPPPAPRAAPRPPPQAATDRRAPPSAAAVPAAEAADRKRCHDILVKTTLGEGLSDGDKDYMRRGCQQPRN
jgi:hypothetical protein